MLQHILRMFVNNPKIFVWHGLQNFFQLKETKVTDIFERFNAKRDRIFNAKRDRIFDCGSRNFTVYSMEAVRC